MVQSDPTADLIAQIPTPSTDISADILGEPWVARRLALHESPAAPGARFAVLVYQREAAPAEIVTTPHAAPRHERAVLYIHGRNDYFFQTHMAQVFLDAGWEFYALDLRACGRAGQDYPSPHDVSDLRVHDEEISEALRIIRDEHHHTQVILVGHSTGGLQACLWAGDHPGSIDGLILNSPWLDLRAPAWIRSYGSALVELIARHHPERVIDSGPNDGEADVYARSMHRTWFGEWDWDLTLKPSPSFPVRAGFLAGIRRAQRDVHHGLGIAVPILMCCAQRTGPKNPTIEDAQRTDIVLSVEQMIARSAFLGNEVTIHQVPDGVHDLALSRPAARADYFEAITSWLATRLS